MTSYKPVREDIIQSARCILNQTWADLELLVVDDASPDEYGPILDDLENLDPRVKLIRLEANGGTYRARNAALEHATGEFITGQDADDWSHPQRIETQVKQLLRHPGTPGNQVYTVNISSELVRIRRGYHPFIPSAPTLMVRAEIMQELGGYLPARKAADNELRGRVAAYAGATIEVIRLPLILMRILPDSLSRADFRPGWQHPARRAFWSAYRTWHRSAPREELRAGGNERFPIHVPARFTRPPAEQLSTDVVFLADLCGDGGLQSSLVDEIQALKSSGLSIGVMHMENAQHLATGARRYHRPVQEMVSAGEILHVLPDEEFHQVGLLVVRSPEILQFMPRGSSAFTPGHLWTVAERPPEEEPVTYLPEACAQHAEEFFGTRPQWAATSTEVRERLHERLPAEDVRQQPYLAPFRPAPYRAPRRRPRSLRPVIGGWAGPLPEEWPNDPSEAELLWPTDGSAEVRLYGDAAPAARILFGHQLPAEWVAFPPEETHRWAYYRSLDFLVHYPSYPVFAPERPVLEALASGLVTILPPRHRPLYGEAAVYAEPAEVPHIVQEYWNDRQLYSAQSQRAAGFSAFHGEEEYVRMMARAVQQGSLQNQEAPA
nr:glycosyltransferase family 2 protein [Nesterenkonia alkaliphila]